MQLFDHPLSGLCPKRPRFPPKRADDSLMSSQADSIRVIQKHLNMNDGFEFKTFPAQWPCKAIQFSDIKLTKEQILEINEYYHHRVIRKPRYLNAPLLLWIEYFGLELRPSNSKTVPVSILRQYSSLLRDLARQIRWVCTDPTGNGGLAAAAGSNEAGSEELLQKGCDGGPQVAVAAGSEEAGIEESDRAENEESDEESDNQIIKSMIAQTEIVQCCMSMAAHISCSS